MVFAEADVKNLSEYLMSVLRVQFGSDIDMSRLLVMTNALLSLVAIPAGVWPHTPWPHTTALQQSLPCGSLPPLPSTV